MYAHFGARPAGPLSSCAPLSLLLFLGALCFCAPQHARALDRDVILEFLPPDEGQVSGYNVYVRDEGTGALEAYDAGHVPADGDGVGRTIVVLASESAYRVTMTAYGPGGESVASNALLVPAVAVCDPSACDDGDPCTLDSCDAMGCIGEPALDGTSCDDGFVDTIEDQCHAGTCEGMLLICRDDFGCDDLNVCNGSETCDGGSVCLAGTPLECGEPRACQVPRCDPALGCQLDDRADGTACDDGRLDTADDVCIAGSCVGQPVDTDIPSLALDEVGPDEVGRGRHTLTILGSGFRAGTRLAFSEGEGHAPKIRSLTLIDESRMEARIQVSGRRPRGTAYWDVVVSRPDGASARLPRGLAVTR